MFHGILMFVRRHVFMCFPDASFLEGIKTVWTDSPYATPGLSVLVSLLLVYISIKLWRRRYDGQRDPTSPQPLPPGEMGWPIVGETLAFAVKGSQFYLEKIAKYGKIYKTHLLGNPTIRISGATYIWPLVSKEPHLLTTKLPASTRNLFGEHSLTNVKGPRHVTLRKKLLPVVSSLRLDDYLPCSQEHMRSHILSWCEKGRISGFKACEDMMGDIILEKVLGWRKEHDPDGTVRAAFITVNENLFSAPFKIPGGGYYKGAKARKIIADFVLQRLASEGDKDHVCMLDVLLASHRNVGEEDALTEEELIDNAVMFLLASTSTTSATLNLLIFMLGKYPEVLSKLREELNSHGLLTPGDSKDLSPERLQKLEFTQCISKEVLRVHPPVGALFRRAEKTIEVGEYQIPKNWSVMYSIRDTHFTSTAFKDREKFMPERWLDKELEERLRRTDVCNYIPFGIGPRSCLGKHLALMEMSLFMVELARLSTWELHNPQASMVYLPVTKPSDDLPVTFTRRI